MTIHTYSLSSIFALQAQEVVSLQCGETIKTINRYGRRNDLHIHWIKAHVGNPGNERADELAKKGTLLPPQSNIALSVRSRKKRYREHMRSKWSARASCVSTRPRTSRRRESSTGSSRPRTRTEVPKRENPPEAYDRSVFFVYKGNSCTMAVSHAITCIWTKYITDN